MDPVVSKYDKSFIKICPCISEIVKKSRKSAYLTIRGLAVTFTFNFLTSKSNWFTFVPSCSEVHKLIIYHHGYTNTSLTKNVFHSSLLANA